MADSRVVAVNHRLRNEADVLGVPVERLRNRLLFQRILARLAPDDRWVVKGGFSLEVRLGLTARATKDLDLLRREAGPFSAVELQDLLDEALDSDAADGFTFAVRVPKQVRVEEEQPSTWRVVVDAALVGQAFGSATIDIVTRAASLEATEPLTIPAVVIGEPVVMAALDVDRQAAEKVHAYARIYAHDRPSSRVKDLVDLALLVVARLVEPQRLRDAVGAVFAERGTDEPPVELPAPPREWDAPFARLASETHLDLTITEAWGLVNETFRTAMTEETP